MEPSEFAAWLDVSRTRYNNWESWNPSGNFPAEEVMAHLCDMIPGLTMDYIYRGKLQYLPLTLAIRLTAREMGLDPDAPGFPAASVVEAVTAQLG